MKRILLIFASLVFWASLVPGQSTSKRTKTNKAAEREVLAVVEKLADAGMKRDVKTIDKYYSDDFIHTNADGSMMTKAQVLASYTSPSRVTIESNKHDEEKVLLYGETAVLTTRVAYRGRVGDQSFNRLYRVTYVLKKMKGRWQVIASHASLIGT